ncbi:kinesin-like protein KIF24 isoform X1 [Cricetulus griseus]|uniref:Kinesin-like protein KIF24 n=1 Tax=Cricetulus griseus TaxID=10029 RepID=A0A9J7JAU5_CRIGR|nr:kinesin-like protein KIF24 isoform X1 [Cricetulus griseus]ERE83272.1 kinesin-like protein KIF24-like protein [Cricetulus griseus]
MASWLYECLCEAELAQYYPHFTALGLQKIDELAKVTMKDYSKLGVHDMNDRKRLFQLIKIIKIMQEEDEVLNSPEHPLQTSNLYNKPQEFRSGPRRQLHFDSPADSKARTASNEACNLSDFSVEEQKSTSLKMLGHMLPDDSQDQTKIRTLNASAAAAYMQTETDTPLFSSNYFSPKLGNGDIPVIQRVSHVLGYNYGIPHSCVRQITSENPWTEMEKIRVCVRIRPLGVREVRRGEVNIITVEDKETLLVHEKKEAVDLTQYILQHVFYFDEVFDEACTNRDVYLKTAHPLIQHIFNGGNATCFAYGQTGAGKTYTMIGTHQIPGLYALAAKDIFRQLKVSRRNLFVWISFYEVYCGQLYDLLNRRKRLFAREDSKHVVQIAGLRELQVDSVELLLQVILKGSKERSTGATGVNADSSRSHAIIQIQIKDSVKRTFGRISFIDLAGSERAADARDSDRQTKMEGAEINQSLLALKECIRALDQEQTHTPFRQSKLTQVLKDSFIGNAKTCMIANISPSHIATEHTLNTLRYADRVKELKKGVKCCASATSRNLTSANSSPKRIQNSPVALSGDKCSPKKVKLGLQQSLTVAPGPTRVKDHPFASHAANIPFASGPKTPNKRGSSRGSPAPEWDTKASPLKGTMRSGHLIKKGAEESAPLCSEKSQIVSKTAIGWESRASGSREGLLRIRMPARGKKVQPVQPVQKQLLSRSQLPGNSHHLEASQDSKVGTPDMLAPEAWTNSLPQQKEREEHLRFYHQQFQQPPLLKQKLKYQPLERLLCQHRPSEGQLPNETISALHSNPESYDGAQVEDQDDSDFSEDSFSNMQKTTLEKSGSSFFLHQKREHSPEEQAAERQQCLHFSSETDSNDRMPADIWVCSKDPIINHARGVLGQSHSPSKLCSVWSKEEDSASSGPSHKDNLAQKPSSSQVGFVHHQEMGEAQAFDIRLEAFRSEVPGQAEGSLPSPENGLSFPLSHIAVPGSPDLRDREVSDDRVTQALGTVNSSVPFQEDSKEQLHACSANASGLMDPLTMSLLETPNQDPSSLEQTAQDRAGHGLMAEITGGPAVGHTVLSYNQEAALPGSSAAAHLWLSSSPPDNRPSGDLPSLSPSPIHQHSPDNLSNRGACQSRRPALLSQNHVGDDPSDDSETKETKLGHSLPFPRKPLSRIHAGVPYSTPLLTSWKGSSDEAGSPWAQDREHPAGLSWQELVSSTDSIKPSDKNILWLQHKPISRCLASDTPVVPSCSLKASGTHCPLTLEQAQQAVIRAHQEQLDEMAELDFREDTLMTQMDSNDFEDFVTQLDKVLALKSSCIQSLRRQLQLYLTCRPAAAPKRTNHAVLEEDLPWVDGQALPADNHSQPCL